MEKDIKKVLVSKEELETRIKELAKEIGDEYKDKNPLVICVLKGAVIFLTDIIREMQIPLDIDFMAVSSYEGIKSKGVVQIIKDLNEPIEGRDLIIMEDILDTGTTLDYIIRLLEERCPNSIKICSLLIKQGTEKIHVNVDYYGFYIPDEFAVGYGLDYNGKYRNLPYIGVLKEEVYTK